MRALAAISVAIRQGNQCHLLNKSGLRLNVLYAISAGLDLLKTHVSFVKEYGEGRPAPAPLLAGSCHPLVRW
jgi:hypothetical protein